MRGTAHTHAARALLTSRGAGRTGAIVAISSLLLMWIWASTIWSVMAASNASVTATDFRVFWGAARLAVSGAGVEAFDVARLAASYGGEADLWLPWVYPPGLLLVIAPLGLLDFFTAWAVFVLASLAAMIGAVRLYAGALRPVWLGFALSPAILPALVLGQVSVIWAAGLIAALACLRDGRLVAAGVLLGLLTFKPQLGVLVALAVVVSGHWRAVAVAAATAILFHGAATLAFGAAYWPAFLDMAGQHAARLRGSVESSELLVSVYSALAAFGLPERAGLTIQWGFSAAAAIAVGLGWAARGIGFDHRAAILVTAIPIASPYLWYGETALLAPALMLLMRAGLLTTRPAGLFLAMLMAAGVTPWLMARLLLADDTFPMRIFATPVLVAAFLVAAIPLMRHLLARPSRP